MLEIKQNSNENQAFRTNFNLTKDLITNQTTAIFSLNTALNSNTQQTKPQPEIMKLPNS